MSKRLPPQVGLEAGKRFLYNPYIDSTDPSAPGFLRAAKMRRSSCCRKVGYTGADGLFRCPSCGRPDSQAIRMFRYFGLFAGRRGGKSVGGARAALNEMLVPQSHGWVCGPTYKILHDSTMPTLLKLIPREWCANWDQDNLELRLINHALVQFRSLDDPDRAHAGVGLHWAWLDEAAFISELAWDYLRPALTDHAGAAYFTSSVDGYDWTYDRIEKKALVEKAPTFWVAKYRTIDNPYIATYRASEVQEAKASMPPALFAQEYEGERQNFTGSVYGEWIDEAWLPTEDAVRAYIPEWPALDASRRVIVGLDSGADHPFGAAKLVVTPKGIVVVKEYLERQRAFSSHLANIRREFSTEHPNILWCANRNEAQLRLEFAAHDILVADAENDQMAGIQRVLSWLYTKQFKIAYTCPRVFDQMKRYRYAENRAADGQKSKEKVFKRDDELPDCLRYALMTWPSLPTIPEAQQGRDLRKLDARTRWELDKLRTYSNRDTQRDLEPCSPDYPMGDFWGNDVADDLYAPFLH